MSDDRAWISLTPLLTAIPIVSVVEATKTHGTGQPGAAREPAEDGDGKRDHSLNLAGERFCLLVSRQQLSRFGGRADPLVAEQDLIDRLGDEIRDGADERAACPAGIRPCLLARSYRAVDDRPPCPLCCPLCLRRVQALNASGRSRASPSGQATPGT
jgi:hypothetical protein